MKVSSEKSFALAVGRGACVSTRDDCKQIFSWLIHRLKGAGVVWLAAKRRDAWLTPVSWRSRVVHGTVCSRFSRSRFSASWHGYPRWTIRCQVNRVIIRLAEPFALGIPVRLDLCFVATVSLYRCFLFIVERCLTAFNEIVIDTFSFGVHDFKTLPSLCGCCQFLKQPSCGAFTSEFCHWFYLV